MMNRKLILSMLLAAAPLSVSGCQNESAAATVNASAATPMSQAVEPKSVSRSVGSVLFDGTAKSRVSSWSAYLKIVSKDDGDYLEEVSERYFGIMHFNNDSEKSELIRIGAPLPEEWVAANHMSESDLRALVGDKDVKAKIFLIDRLLARMQDLTQQAGASTYLEVVNALPEAERPAIDKDRQEAMILAASLFSENPTPFNAYQYGLAFSASTGTTGGIPAAMTVAGELGDPRASKLLASYNATASGEEGKLTEGVIATMRGMVKVGGGAR